LNKVIRIYDHADSIKNSDHLAVMLSFGTLWTGSFHFNIIVFLKLKIIDKLMIIGVTSLILNSWF
jgi:hypothetical protein